VLRTKLPDNLLDLRVPIKTHVDSWLINALSTDTDIAAAEAAVSCIFRGYPRKITWVDYPFAQHFNPTVGPGIKAFELLAHKFEQMDAVIAKELPDFVAHLVERKFRRYGLGDITWFHILLPIINSQISIIPNTWKERESIHSYFGLNKIACSFDIHWGYYEFMSSILHHKIFELVGAEHFFKLHRSCGGAYETADGITLYPKPSDFHLDESNRLHSPNSPAIDFNGHYTVYAWHGTVVDEKVIMHPNDITPEEIINEQNATIAQIKLERLTIPNLITKAHPIIIDRDCDTTGNVRRLLSISLKGPFRDPNIMCVQVICPSTNKTYLLRVPPNMCTCAEAVAWTFGVDKKDYAPIIEK
jgi:hypothetical protein